LFLYDCSEMHQVATKRNTNYETIPDVETKKEHETIEENQRKQDRLLNGIIEADIIIKISLDFYISSILSIIMFVFS
jgi:hypothetical protein